MTKQALIGCAVVIVLAALLVVIIAGSVIVYRMPGPEPARAGVASPAIDPADPDRLPPIRVGERVEALSTEGWQKASVLTLVDGTAEIDYDTEHLPIERLDVRLLRRVAQSMDGDMVASPAGSEARPLAATPRPTGTMISAAPPKARVATIPDMRAATPPTIADDAYLGCFINDGEFVLDGYQERSSTNLPQACIATCRGLGYAFAGLQNGERCRCGDEYGLQGESDRCGDPCTGDAAQTCGGSDAEAIYMTGWNASAERSGP